MLPENNLVSIIFLLLVKLKLNLKALTLNKRNLYYYYAWEVKKLFNQELLTYEKLV